MIIIYKSLWRYVGFFAGFHLLFTRLNAWEREGAQPPRRFYKIPQAEKSRPSKPHQFMSLWYLTGRISSAYLTIQAAGAGRPQAARHLRQGRTHGGQNTGGKLRRAKAVLATALERGERRRAEAALPSSQRLPGTCRKPRVQRRRRRVTLSVRYAAKEQQWRSARSVATGFAGAVRHRARAVATISARSAAGATTSAADDS